MKKNYLIIISIVLILVAVCVGWYVGRRDVVHVPDILPNIPLDIREYIASYSDKIIIAEPLPGSAVSSPVKVSGEARGSWFFEGDFPIVVVNWDGLIIGEGYVSAQGDWMTEEFVPFAGAITFEHGDSYSDTGTLIFQKDNPSGLPEHDDALEIPIILD